MAGNTRDAKCTTPNSTSFTEYLATCKQDGYDAQLNNFFANVQYTQSIQKEKDEFTDLIATGQGIADMAGLSQTTITDVQTRNSVLQKKKDLLDAEIKAIKAQGDAADRSFMDNVVYGNPKSGSAPSLQDLALLLFWFAWIFMAIVLVAVRWFSPNGNWTSALFTFSVLAFVTLFIYAILQQVA
jgi:hypothetical protein